MSTHVSSLAPSHPNNGKRSRMAKKIKRLLKHKEGDAVMDDPQTTDIIIPYASQS